METEKSLYDKFCGYLDSIGFKYQRFDDKFTVETGVSGKDLPIRLKVIFDDKPLRMWLWSSLPVSVTDGKRKAACSLAINAINDQLFLGNFDFDSDDGTIGYELTTLYEGCTVDDPGTAFGGLLYLASEFIDKYNEKIAALAMGMIDLDEFMKKIGV